MAAPAISILRYLRHRAGDVKDFARNHVLSRTACFVFEAEGESECAKPVPVHFRFGTRADLDRFTLEDHEYGDEAREFGMERLKAGDSLIVGEDGGRVVFYAWLMHGEIDLDYGVIVPAKANVAYSYKVFTVASARGRRICGGFYQYIRRELEGMGQDRLVCRVGTGNASSIRAHKAAGFKPVGALTRLVVPGRVLYRADEPLREWCATTCRPGQFNASGWLVGKMA